VARIVLTAQVEDAATWERMFRTRGELLRRMSSTATYFATTDGNEVALYAEPADLDTFLEMMQSPDIAAAMEGDGVKRDTVRFYVLDKEFRY
jgi:hypothetical protein